MEATFCFTLPITCREQSIISSTNSAEHHTYWLIKNKEVIITDAIKQEQQQQQNKNFQSYVKTTVCTCKVHSVHI